MALVSNEYALRLRAYQLAMYFIAGPLISTGRPDYEACDGELGSHSHLGSFRIKTYILYRSDKGDSEQSAVTLISFFLFKRTGLNAEY